MSRHKPLGPPERWLSLYSIDRIAGVLGVSRRTVIRWTYKGLPSIKIGKRRWISPVLLMEWAGDDQIPGWDRLFILYKDAIQRGELVKDD